MSVLESLAVALGSLGANKLRTTLTMLGIIIGVSAVIALMSIGRGAQAQVTAQIQSLGTNLLFTDPRVIEDSRRAQRCWHRAHADARRLGCHRAVAQRRRHCARERVLWKQISWPTART